MTFLEDGSFSSHDVELEHAGPQAQNRWKLGFRVILAIPHLVYALVLGIVGGLALVVTWCCALVLGRVPQSLHTFLAGIAEYLTRVYAYSVHLLTDEYPKFTLHDDRYPVLAVIPAPRKVSRVAVLFRLILAIPAGIVTSVIGSGVTAAAVFVWLIVLIKGRQPRALHQALLAALRYQLRFYAWFGMLTSEYPGELFGDDVPMRGEPAEVAPDELAAAPAPVGAPLAELPEVPRTSVLTLTKGAKRIVVVLIVVGALTTIGTNVAGIARSAQSNAAANELQDDHAVLEDALRDFGTTSQTCSISGGAQCAHKADNDLADALDEFRDQVRAIGYPAFALGLAGNLEDATADFVDVLHRRSQTDEVETYQQITADVQDVANAFDRAYAELLLSLQAGSTVRVSS